MSIHGPHGQYIENIHLERYTSPEDFFDRLYEGPYKKLLTKAEQFVKETGGSSDDTLVFIRYCLQFKMLPLACQTIPFAAVVLMLANTSMSPCQDTDVQSQWSFITGLHGMHVPLLTE